MKSSHLSILGHVAVVIMTILVLPSCSTRVKIDEDNFPDPNFREWLLTQDYGRDGILTGKEISSITSIDVGHKDIANLKGIENFTNLEKLECPGNHLEALDVSELEKLTELNCCQNELKSLNVSKCKALTRLLCDKNQLTSLDLAECKSLQLLDCSENPLASLDLSSHDALTYLSSFDCELTSLNVSGCTSLQEMHCDGCKLTSLNVSGCTSLQGLYCSKNKLTSLDVSSCKELNSLGCFSNQLKALDVSSCTKLEFIYCSSLNEDKGDAMYALVASLPSRKEKANLQVIDSYRPGDIPQKHHQIAAKANAKGWDVEYKYANGVEWWWHIATR